MSTRNSIFSLTIATAVTLATLGLSGCTLENTAASEPATYTVGTLQGRIMGGETPVAGSQITLWETDPGNTGYGKTAKILAGPITGSTPGGNFQFSTSYTCDAGQFLYVTSTGGDVTNGSTSPIINPNLVMVSALGSCSNFGTTAAKNSTVVVVNELTTIAAAYAIGSFITVNENVGTGTAPVGTQLVYIGAPAKNNAAAGSCTGAGSAMTCTAAGLAHAFANATNLVDSVHFNGSFPQGAVNANTTVPGNALGSVPQAAVDMLANILAYCTNSAGGAASGTGGTSDATNCGNLFSNAKPVSCSASSCAPMDTLTAAIDIAKNPSHDISGLFAYASATGPFQPTQTGTPQSLALAITYTGSSGTTFGSPQYLALDANDNVYVLAGDYYNSAAVSPASTSSQSGLWALSSAGAPLWTTGYNTNLCTPRFLATDTVGNVWASNFASSTTTCAGTAVGSYGVYGYSQANGSATTSFTSATGSQLNGQSQPLGVAIDQYNNVWITRGSTTCTGCLFEIPYSGGATPGGTYGSLVTQASYGTGTNQSQSVVENPNQIVIDQNQNVWYSTIGTSSTYITAALYVLPNTNAANYSTAGKPTYTESGGFPYVGPGTAGYSFGLVIDSANNAWDTATNMGTAQITQLTTPTTGGVISGTPSPSGVTITGGQTKPYETQFDGGGQLWYPYYSSTGEIYFVYNPLGTSVTGGVTQSTKGIVPCYEPSGATTCTAGVVAYPRTLQIDSSGAIWTAGVGTATAAPGNGALVQILGAAYPTWPQLSYSHFEVEPQ